LLHDPEQKGSGNSRDTHSILLELVQKLNAKQDASDAKQDATGETVREIAENTLRIREDIKGAPPTLQRYL
jgi:hypothetical protein